MKPVDRIPQVRLDPTLPRLHRRGSIEAGYVNLFSPDGQGSPFHDFTVVAPLKPAHQSNNRLVSYPFHDFTVVAPLKL